MKSRGIAPEVLVWVGIALIVTAIVAGAIAYRLNPGLDLFGSLIPSGNKSIDVRDGLAIVGIDLKDELQLKYYTGSEWVAAKSGKIELDEKEIDVDNLRRNLEDFYLGTLRDGAREFSYRNPPRSFKLLNPSSFSESVNSKYELGYYSGEAHSLASTACIGNSNLDFVKQGVYVFGVEDNLLDGSCRAIFMDVDDRFYVPSTGNALSGLLSDSNRIVSDGNSDYSGLRYLSLWRDQILSGGACEKHLEIMFKENGLDIREKYAVRRMGNMLFVDLNSRGGEEKYSAGCFKEETNRASYVSDAEISIKFELKNEVQEIYWGDSPGGRNGCAKGWYVRIGNGDYFSADINWGENDFKMNLEEKKSFVDGLDIVVRGLDVAGGDDYYNVRAEIVDGEQRKLIYRAIDGEVDSGAEKKKMLSDIMAAYEGSFVAGSPEENIVVAKEKIISLDIGATFNSIDYSLPEEPTVEKSARVEWRENGGWYFEGERFATGLNRRIGYPSIDWKREYDSSFSEGLPYVLKGLGDYVWKPGADKPERFYPSLNVQVNLEGGALDLSDYITSHLPAKRELFPMGGVNLYGRRLVSYNLIREESADTDEVLHVSKIITEYYQAVHAGAYCA